MPHPDTTKEITIHCPLCQREMRPYSPKDSEREEYWLCADCKAIFYIEQMPWYPTTEQTKITKMI